MACSNRLRTSDVVAAMRLVGECRDIGRDPAAWLGHAGDGLRGLIGGQVAVSQINPPAGYLLNRGVVLMLDAGWETEVQRRLHADYMASERQLEDPTFRRFLGVRRPDMTIRPRTLVDGRAYRRTAIHDFYTRTVGVDDFVYSERSASTAASTVVFSVWRRHGDRRYAAREVRLIGLFHDELARLVGPVLDDGRDPAAALSPRLRQTLDLLLAGDSEKQIALRLGISRHTVHDYAVALYRRFAVRSRGELLARRLGRSGR